MDAGGTEVEVLEKNGTRTKVRAEINGQTIEGWVYHRFVAEPTGASGASGLIPSIN